MHEYVDRDMKAQTSLLLKRLEDAEQMISRKHQQIRLYAPKQNIIPGTASSSLAVQVNSNALPSSNQSISSSGGSTNLAADDMDALDDSMLRDEDDDDLM